MSIGYVPHENKPTKASAESEPFHEFHVTVELDDGRKYGEFFETEDDAMEYAGRVKRRGFDRFDNGKMALYPVHRIEKVLVELVEHDADCDCDGAEAVSETEVELDPELQDDDAKRR